LIIAKSKVGESDDLQCGFFFASCETITINFKESVGRHKSGALVAIDVRVTFDDSRAIDRRKFEEARWKKLGGGSL